MVWMVNVIAFILKADACDIKQVFNLIVEKENPIIGCIATPPFCLAFPITMPYAHVVYISYHAPPLTT